MSYVLGSAEVKWVSWKKLHRRQGSFDRYRIPHVRSLRTNNSNELSLAIHPFSKINSQHPSTDCLRETTQKHASVGTDLPLKSVVILPEKRMLRIRNTLKFTGVDKYQWLQTKLESRPLRFVNRQLGQNSMSPVKKLNFTRPRQAKSIGHPPFKHKDPWLYIEPSPG